MQFVWHFFKKKKHTQSKTTQKQKQYKCFIFKKLEKPEKLIDLIQNKNQNTLFTEDGVSRKAFKYILCLHIF